MNKYLLLFLLLLPIANAGNLTVNESISLLWNGSVLKISHADFHDSVELHNSSYWFNDYRWSRNYTIQNEIVYLSNCSFNYTADFENLLDEIIELRLEMRDMNNSREEHFYSLYLDCFSNLTSCSEYKSTNEGYRDDADLCTSREDSLKDKIIRMEGEYFKLNTTLINTEKQSQNYAGQRFIWAFLIAIVTIGGCFWYYNVRPENERRGTSPTSKEIGTSVDVEHSLDPNKISKPILKKPIISKRPPPLGQPPRNMPHFNKPPQGGMNHG